MLIFVIKLVINGYEYCNFKIYKEASALTIYLLICRKKCLMILVVVCWRMLGRGTTVPSLHMDKLVVESLIPWLAMGQTKV